jgi:hypothetical protein
MRVEARIRHAHFQFESERVFGSVMAPDRLSPFALHGNRVNLYIQHDEAPQLVEFEVHPELFGFREFFLCVHDVLLFRDQLPAEQAFEFPDESVMKHELHPCAA